MQSEQINELAAALAKAQGAMNAATKNSLNPHFKNRYADLAAVIEATREALAANGLAITQVNEIRENGFVLLTTLMHSSGQWMASEWPLPMAGRPQEQGSALTYARRYCWQSIAGIAAEDDDDAEGARVRNQTASAPTNGKGRTKAERETPDDPRYLLDEQGDPIDNIPWGDPTITQLGAMDVRNDARKADEEMFRKETVKALLAWGKIMGNRLASWPEHWQVQFRNKFEDRKQYLIAEEQQAAQQAAE